MKKKIDWDKEKTGDFTTLTAIKTALERSNENKPMLIRSCSKYVLEAITDKLQGAEDRGFIEVENVEMIRAKIARACKRRGRTFLVKVDKDDGTEGEKAARREAKAAINRNETEETDYDVLPEELRISGAKLKCMTQWIATKAIWNCHEVPLFPYLFLS